MSDLQGKYIFKKDLGFCQYMGNEPITIYPGDLLRILLGDGYGILTPKQFEGMKDLIIFDDETGYKGEPKNSY